MDPTLRAAFNAAFRPEEYAALVRCVNESEKWPADFRISETPIFLTREFTDEVTRAANEIVAATHTPEKQKTRGYFAATETVLGIRPVCVTKIKKRGRQLFYDRDGREVRIERIYNRVIFDELSQRTDLNLQFRLQDDLDVTWVGHP